MDNQNNQVNKYIKLIYYIPICHRLPDRTFSIHDHYFPVCSRCTGLYIGVILFLTYSLFFFIDYSDFILLIAFIITLPMIIDGLTQYLNFRESNNIIRLITGFAAGIGIALLISFFKILII